MSGIKTRLPEVSARVASRSGVPPQSTTPPGGKLSRCSPAGPVLPWAWRHALHNHLFPHGMLLGGC